MDISVIIVNYNTKDLIKDCIDSIIINTNNVSYEIIVVDNNSQDGSIEILEKSYPDVLLIKSPVNLGFGKANNLGIKAAKGKYLFFLNSDTILLNNALKYFYDYSESNSGFGALGSILLDANHSPCHSYGSLISIKDELRIVIARYLRFFKQKELLHPEIVISPKEVGYITGADLWVPREIYDLLGGFDPNFFMYCEEVDWQQRMANANLKRIVIPGPKIMHLEGGSDPSKTKIWSVSRLKNMYQSKRYYYKKHFSKIKYPFFKIGYVILNTPSLILLTIKNRQYAKLLKYQ